jgi:prepilin signal peptidase PulO-like enzyme (type II secretory pathway)
VSALATAPAPHDATLVASQFAAVLGPALLGVLAWGLLAGWVVAWIAHRYHEGLDDDGYDIAVLGVARCEHCHHELPLEEVAPFQAFRCARCRLPLPMTWWFTQFSVAVSCVAMLAAFGTRIVLIPFLWLVPVLVLAAVVDARTFLIPKRVVWIGFGVGLALITAVSLIVGHPRMVERALIGSVGYFTVLFITNLINPAGMGFGDVRLAVVLGLYLGWIDLRLPLYGLLLASLMGLVFGLVRRATAATEAGKAFPFGPGLAAGTLGAVFLSQALLR